MLTTYGINKVREDFKNSVAYAAYRVENREIRAEITNKTILPDGEIQISFLFSAAEIGQKLIDNIKLYDNSGNAIVEQNENISISDLEENFLYLIKFKIAEKGA